MGRNLEARVRALEQGTPGGYRTYDGEGNVVIDSALPTGEWLAWATKVLRDGRKAAKAELIRQLARSARAEDGGTLHEYLLAAYGPALYGDAFYQEQPPDSAPERKAKR